MASRAANADQTPTSPVGQQTAGGVDRAGAGAPRSPTSSRGSRLVTPPIRPAITPSTRDGVTTQLGNDIAFTARGRQVACTTDSKHTGGALACLVDADQSPARPETAYGEWKGGWVDFDGTNLQIGAARGDPGPFVNGNGPELANGDSLSFDDYRCRADQAGLFCVNYAHQSAVRFSSAGIEQFGCLRSVPPPDGVGIAFSC